MSTKEHVAMLHEGVATWNEWRVQNPGVSIDLNGARLTDRDLSGADLSGVNLRGAKLARSTFARANLQYANLDSAFCNLACFDSADMSHVSARWARFFRATLRSTLLTDADLLDADFNEADMKEANLGSANLKLATLTRTNLSRAVLTGCRVFGASVWRTVLTDSIQDSLIVTDEQEAQIKVDNLELAQFVYLLLDHRNLRSVINTVTRSGVLILGRFGGGGLAALHTIAGELRARGFVPMIFDFVRPESHSYTETVVTLAGLSTFVIVDLSGPSVPQELQAVVSTIHVPYVSIIEDGRGIFSTWPDFYDFNWVYPNVFRFRDTVHLREQIPPIIEAAAGLISKRKQSLANTFRGP